VTGALLLAAAMFFAGRGCAGDETGWGWGRGVFRGGGWCRAPTVVTRVDTVIVRDTLRERVFVPVERRIARVDTVWLERLGGDAVAGTSLAEPNSGDTARVEVAVPIERVIYRTDDYRAVVEGFRPALVELDIFRTTTIVTKIPIPRRWSVGLQAGYGLTPHGPAPYLGLGVEYRLF
jgi:hypothetical protein